MSEPNHLRKANQLRFSFALVFIVFVGLCIIGVQKVMQWRAEAQIEKDRTEQSLGIIRGTASPEEPAALQRQPVTNQRLAAVTPRERTSVSIATTNAATAASAAANVSATETSNASTEVAEPPHVTGGSGSSTNSPSIVGTITLLGTPPPEKVIEPLQKDPICGKQLTNIPMTRFYLVSSNQGLANVFVYITKSLEAKSLSFRGQKEAVLLDQVGCFYEPYVMGVMVDQKIRIRNSDPVLHNVHATPTSNTEFNFAQPVQGQVNEKSFSKPEVLVRMKCDVHPWMFAYVGVVSHPYFAVTDAEGRFEINDVPDGDYLLEAVHPKAGRRTVPIKVDHRVAVQPTRISLSVPQN